MQRFSERQESIVESIKKVNSQLLMKLKHGPF